MSLLNPSALLLLLIALPITLLYVLRVRLRRAPVSSLMFWQKALADQPPRAFWQRFRHLAWRQPRAVSHVLKQPGKQRSA